MRVSEEGPKKSKAQKAVESVQKENNLPITSKDSTKIETAGNFTFFKYTDLNGHEISLGKQQLISLGREFVHWTQENPRAVLKQAFWNARGITYETVKYWCERDKDFKELWNLAGQCIGNKREEVLMEDFTHLRGRQSVYVPEYKEFDEYMIELKERVKHALEQQAVLNHEQIAEVIKNSFYELGSRERVNAESRRPRLNQDNERREQSTTSEVHTT